MQLSKLTNDELLIQTDRVVRVERESTANVIKHFQEIQRRKIYLDRGFANLYQMVTQRYGYSEASAMRRINSMRLINDLPEVEAKLEAGEISLTVAATVQSFFYQEAKAYTRIEKLELIETCVGKSSREVERELVKRNPEREKRESVRFVSNERVRVSFSISEELNQKLEKIKALISHSDPGCSTENLIGKLAELGLEKFDPIRKAARAKRRAATSKPHPPAPEVTIIKEQKAQRAVPAQERATALARYDQKGCEFVDSKTGRRCSSSHFIQIDHVQSFALGGSHEAVNLQFLCGAHNRLKWKQGSRLRYRN